MLGFTRRWVHISGPFRLVSVTSVESLVYLTDRLTDFRGAFHTCDFIKRARAISVTFAACSRGAIAWQQWLSGSPMWHAKVMLNGSSEMRLPASHADTRAGNSRS